MKTELDKKVAKAMVMVRRRHIVDRMLEVIKHYKGETIVETAGRTEYQGLATLNIAGAPVELSVRSCGQHHEHLLVKARYGGKLMFAALRSRNLDVQRVDPRRVIHGNDYTLVVDYFLSGVWMHALELKRLIRQEQAYQRKLQREREAQERAKERVPVFVEGDGELAQRFGIRT